MERNIYSINANGLFIRYFVKLILPKVPKVGGTFKCGLSYSPNMLRPTIDAPFVIICNTRSEFRLLVPLWNIVMILTD